MKTNVLIVEDHRLMVESYKKIISAIEGAEFVFYDALDCDRAKEILMDVGIQLDYIFMDIKLPSTEQCDVASGEALIELSKNVRPNVPILILTSHVEPLFLYDLFVRFSPSAFMIKSDFTGEEITHALEEVIIRNKTYQTRTVSEAIRALTQNSLYLDSYNRQILLLLNKGVKTKSMPRYLNLSISAIDKRKGQIKEFLQIEKGSDEEILSAARASGWL